MSNPSPLIGILAMDMSKTIDVKSVNNYKSYISSSYVKYLECSGARVVPIWIGKDDNYYHDILQIINGVLVPGGEIGYINVRHCQASASFKKIYKIACEMNKEGTYLPIWGTCLGFEILLYAASNGANPSRYLKNRKKVLMKLELHKNFQKSKLFGDIPYSIAEILQDEPVAYHNHRFCVAKNKLDLVKDWLITSTNRDDESIEFISSIEHKIYPFYGVAFHPEKPQFEFFPHNIPHSPNAIKASQYFSNFFVDECRKNLNLFDPPKHGKYLISNFTITLTGSKEQGWRQGYFFTENVDYPSIVLECDDFDEN